MRNKKFLALPSDADKISVKLYRMLNKEFDNIWIIRLHKRNYTVREISEILEISRSAIFRRINKLKKLDYIKKFLKS